MFDTSMLDFKANKREELVEQVLKELNLKNLVNLEALQNLQDNLAAVSGIAMVTVDYKGTPITKETSFSKFCQARREIAECKANCFFSDAYGSLRAAMLDSPYVYRCPAGLVDCAVPIIVENNHIGAVLMGQVRCEEAETDSLEKIQNLIKNEIEINDYPGLKAAFQETNVISLSHLQKTGQLVQYLICEMVEKELTLKIQEGLHQEISHLQTQLHILKKDMAEAQDQTVISESYVSQYMLSSLELLSTMAISEEADQTIEGISLYTKILNKVYNSENGLISIHTELDFIRSVVEMLSEFFEKKIQLDIDTSTYLNDYYIPPFIIYPFIENSIIHGILPHKQEGRIKLIVRQENEQLNIWIKDNGVGAIEEKMGKPTQQTVNPRLSSLDIENIQRRLVKIFGSEGFIEVSSNVEDENEEVEFSVKISIPSQK